MDSIFLPLFMKYIDSCIDNDFTDNYDVRRFGFRMGFKHKVRSFLASSVRVAGFLKPLENQLARQRCLRFIEPHIGKIEWLYQSLSDEQSRQTLIQIFAYRALGYRKVKLPLNNPDYWAYLEAIERQLKDAESIDLGFKGWQAHKINLASVGYPVELFCRPSGVMAQYVLQQYRCPTSWGAIEVSEGDTVLDAGGCYGDTALYFACKANSKGEVYSFEFLPDNLEILRRNLTLNSNLSKRIHIVEHPLWSRTGERLFIVGNGPGTRVLPSASCPKTKQITTLSIDDFVCKESLGKVDFIKMDIEGAELQALYGAAETIRRFQPKLAISVYHNLADFWTIPQYLDTLKLRYRYYLRHFTIHAEETILFAETSQTQ